MEHPLVITVSDDGKARVIYHPKDWDKVKVFVDPCEVTAEGDGMTVEPLHWLPRLAFKALRKAFGRNGRVASWTRTWGCRWRGRMHPDDPTITFEVEAGTHREVVDIEINKLVSIHIGEDNERTS